MCSVCEEKKKKNRCACSPYHCDGADAPRTHSQQRKAKFTTLASPQPPKEQNVWNVDLCISGERRGRCSCSCTESGNCKLRRSWASRCDWFPIYLISLALPEGVRDMPWHCMSLELQMKAVHNSFETKEHVDGWIYLSMEKEKKWKCVLFSFKMAREQDRKGTLILFLIWNFDFDVKANFLLKPSFLCSLCIFREISWTA